MLVQGSHWRRANEKEGRGKIKKWKRENDWCMQESTTKNAKYPLIAGAKDLHTPQSPPSVTFFPLFLFTSSVFAFLFTSFLSSSPTSFSCTLSLKFPSSTPPPILPSVLSYEHPSSIPSMPKPACSPRPQRTGNPSCYCTCCPTPPASYIPLLLPLLPTTKTRRRTNQKK